jgi:hypothetical protein
MILAGIFQNVTDGAEACPGSKERVKRRKEKVNPIK